ncbi:MAG: P-II family nitrogen regulator [Gammaproteobacteria bacterium]|nr:P-II family nitrogen regulator [Gammaproteobacteria bacterium]
MEFRKVTAIIRQEKLQAVEEAMHRPGVPGLSVTKVKGYGDCATFYARDWLVTLSRVGSLSTRQMQTRSSTAYWTPHRPG